GRRLVDRRLLGVDEGADRQADDQAQEHQRLAGPDDLREGRGRAGRRPGGRGVQRVQRLRHGPAPFGVPPRAAPPPAPHGRGAAGVARGGGGAGGGGGGGGVGG